MGETYLLDTNAVSKYLAEELPEWALALIDSMLDDKPAQISIITRIELLVYKPLLRSRESLIRAFVAESEVFGLTEEIIQQTVRLRRQYKSVKLPDAIIAATAMVYDFTLLSTNDSDFEKIQGLTYKSLTN
jgi:predicted nucleic acid-binding protein